MSSSKSNKIDHELVRKLAELLSETDLNEIEIEHESMRLRLSRNNTPVPVTQVVQAAPAAALASAPAAAPIPAATAATPASSASSDALKSPMVGTAYLSPEPGADTFVSVGDSVKAGQTVLIIEAMKTMNQIPADRDGVVQEILISDAQPVEFGEPLIVIA